MAPRPWPTRSSWPRSSGCWATRRRRRRCRRPSPRSGICWARPGRSRRSSAILAIRDQVAPPTINLDTPAVDAEARPRAERGAEARDQRRAVELLRLRRHQRLAGAGAGRTADVAVGRLECADAVRRRAGRRWRGCWPGAATAMSSPGPLAQPICLRVESGATMSRCSRSLLAAQGAISQRHDLSVGAEYSGKSAALKFGQLSWCRRAPRWRRSSTSSPAAGRAPAAPRSTIASACWRARWWCASWTRRPTAIEEVPSFDPGDAAAAPAAYAEVEAARRHALPGDAGRGGDQLAGGRGAEAGGFPDGEVAEVPARGQPGARQLRGDEGRGARRRCWTRWQQRAGGGAGRPPGRRAPTGCPTRRRRRR